MTADVATVVASFHTLDEAVEARRYLAGYGLSEEGLDLAARGLRPIELVHDPRTYALAALEGTAVGGALGALTGLLLALGGLPALPGVALVLGAALIAAVLGGLLGAFAHALVGLPRALVARTSIRADHYDLVAVPGLDVARARRLLAAREPWRAEVGGSPALRPGTALASA